MTAVFQIGISLTGPGTSASELSGFAMGGTLDSLGGGFDEVFILNANPTTPAPAPIVDAIFYSLDGPSHVVGIILRVRCFTALPLDVDSNECTALADPLFSFDQAAFDQQQGQDTFQLEDYYAISLSPGISNGEPLPAPALPAWAFAALGVLLVSLTLVAVRASRVS